MDFDKLLNDLHQGKHLLESDLINIFTRLIDVMSEEDNLLVLHAPINVIGDVHGQLFDVFNLMDKIKENGLDGNRYLFLGDFVDRGHFSIETIAYLAILKLQHPEKFFLLRGNHESPVVNQVYGLYNDCQQLYGSLTIWSLVNKAFQSFQLAAVIDGTYFCVHGGLSPELRLIEQLYPINRMCDIPEKGIMADLTWSDPIEEAKRWSLNKRGSGYTFGRNETEEFLRNNGLKMVVRSHQLASEGYNEMFMKDGKPQLLTVWSAPNYCYCSGNKATFMAIDENLDYRLIEFDSKQEVMYNDGREETVCPYFA